MPEIPDKLFFKISEVARLAKVEPYVLRFWQREFKQLNPRKNSKGQRRYNRKDVELVLTIAHLRYHEKYTIDGIKKVLRSQKEPVTLDSVSNPKTTGRTRQQHIRDLFNQVRAEVQALLALIDRGHR